jgi:hypothetical protein
VFCQQVSLLLTSLAGRDLSKIVSLNFNKDLIVKTIFVFLIMSTLPISWASAATLNFKALCSLHGEYIEIDEQEAKNDGWVTTEDAHGDTVYSLQVTTDTAQLPMNRYLEDLSLSVSETGLLEIGISVGDFDASADSSIQLPVGSNGILPMETFVWKVSGGDHASGAWSFDCTAEISIVK